MLMNCKNCGFLLNDGDKFCKNCGSPSDFLKNQTVNDTYNVVNNNQDKGDFVGFQSLKVDDVNNINQSSNETSNGDLFTPSNFSSSSVNGSNTFDGNQTTNLQSINTYQKIMDRYHLEDNFSNQKREVESASSSYKEYDNKENISSNQVSNNLNENVSEEFDKSKLKSNDNIKYAIFGVLMAIMIALIVIIVLIVTKDSGNSNFINRDDNTNIPTPPVCENKTSNSKAIIGAYIFEISQNLNVSVNNQGLILTDSENTFKTLINLFEGNYELLKSRINMLEESLKNAGITVKDSISIKTYEEVEYILIQVTVNDIDTVVAYTQIDATVMASIVVSFKDNSTDLEKLAIVSPIIKSAIKTEQREDIMIPQIDVSEHIKNILSQ